MLRVLYACFIIPKISLTLHTGVVKIYNPNVNYRRNAFFWFSLQEYCILVWGVNMGWFHWSDVYIVLLTGSARSHTY